MWRIVEVSRSVHVRVSSFPVSPFLRFPFLGFPFLAPSCSEAAFSVESFIDSRVPCRRSLPSRSLPSPPTVTVSQNARPCQAGTGTRRSSWHTQITTYPSRPWRRPSHYPPLSFPRTTLDRTESGESTVSVPVGRESPRQVSVTNV